MKEAKKEAKKPERLLKLKDVAKRTSRSRTSIYRAFAQGGFPIPVRVGTRGIAWRESEVNDWIESREPIQERAE